MEKYEMINRSIKLEENEELEEDERIEVKQELEEDERIEVSEELEGNEQLDECKDMKDLEDIKWMERALELARKGEGSVNPNPLVGAVIVKNGVIIGEGYHSVFGGNHAEVNAFEDYDRRKASLNKNREDETLANSLDKKKKDKFKKVLLEKEGEAELKDACIYVTLEPCCHYGKTPPCADLIIKRGIGRVVIGMKDVNPKVSGKGIERLEKHGIVVSVGVLEKECRLLNEVFIKYMNCKRPFVLMKSAMSLDGKIATKTGESKWISCIESRREVMSFRNKYSGIMVGVNTVNIDNPKLTCRDKEGRRNPIRIVIDSKLRIRADANLIRDGEAKTIVFTTDKANFDRCREFGSVVVDCRKKIISDKDNIEIIDYKADKFKVMEDCTADKIRVMEDCTTDKFRVIENCKVDEFRIMRNCKVDGIAKEKSTENVYVVIVDELNGHVNLEEVMRVLGEFGVDGVLLEGGGTLNYEAIISGIVDKVCIYIAPKIIGGYLAKSPVEGEGISFMEGVINLSKVRFRNVGIDIAIEGYFL